MNSHERASEKTYEAIVRFETGQLSEPETIQLFQRLIDDGSVWRMQGTYGRLAQQLIESGYCMLSEGRQQNYFGATVGSRFDVPAGDPGSREFVEAHHPDSPTLQ